MVAFELSEYLHKKITHMHAFDLSTCTTNYTNAILTLLSALQTFKNSTVRMAGTNNSAIRCSEHILFIKIKLQHAHLADVNSFQTLCF